MEGGKVRNAAPGNFLSSNRSDGYGRWKSWGAHIPTIPRCWGGSGGIASAAWEQSEGCHFLSHDPGSVRCRDAREGAGELILYLSFW